MKKHLSPLFLAIIIILIFSACKTASKKDEQKEEEEEEAPAPPISIGNNTSFVDISYFPKYLSQIDHRNLSESQCTKYDVKQFAAKPINPSTLHLLDSIQLQPNVYALLIAERTPDIKKAWLATYTSNNKYIDSRIVFWEQKADNRDESIHSILQLPKMELLLFDSDCMMEDKKEIPIKIHPNGKFEDLPDTPFSKKEITMGACAGNAFSEKLPIGEVWTTFNFDRKQIFTLKTTQNYIDYIGDEITQIEQLEKETVFPDIAFKGRYSKSEAKILELVKQNDTDLEELTQYIREQPMVDGEHFAEGGFNVTELYSYTIDERTYRFAKCTRPDGYDGSYACLVGLDPDHKATLLAFTCMYEFYIFQLKNDIMLYTQRTSCEGAYGTSYVYKLNNGFEKIFEESLGCD